MQHKKLTWPNGKLFAFSIFDDTDFATMDNVAPVYSFLKENGFLSTKSVWPLDGSRKPLVGGDTCDDPKYLAWVKQLQEDGFEIGFHNATFHTSPREQTRVGLQKFYRDFGGWPRTMANHADCQENIYWGDYRLSGINRSLYNVLTKGRNRNLFRGHVEGDPLFWGDLCKEHITYVRNFVFRDINTLKECPFTPYHDPARPYVNFWFASSEGASVQSFNETISEENQDRLEAEGGACIMYVHFAVRFYRDGHLNKRFEALVKRLAKKKGWFVPVSVLLDYVREHQGEHVITDWERTLLETKWLLQKMRFGSS